MTTQLHATLHLIDRGNIAYNIARNIAIIVALIVAWITGNIFRCIIAFKCTGTLDYTVPL